MRSTTPRPPRTDVRPAPARPTLLRSARPRAAAAGVLAGLLLLAAVPSVLAQAGPRLSVEECVSLGLARNRGVRAARHAAEEAQSALEAERTRRLPDLSGQGTYRRLSPNVPDFSFEFPEGSGLPNAGENVVVAPAIRDRYDLSLQLEQPLFAGGAIENAIEARSHTREAAAARAARSEHDLELAVRTAYWSLYGSENRLRAIQTALRQVETQLENVRRMRELGTALESDVLALETRLSEVELELLRAREQTEQARLRLNRLTGRRLDAPVVPTDTVTTVDSVRAEARALLERAVGSRARLAARRSELQAARSRVDVAQSNWWPQIGVVGSYQYARPNPLIVPQEDAFRGTWTVGLNASLDLWNWGRTGERVQEARAAARRAEDLLADARSEVRTEVHEKILHLRRRRQEVEVARRARRQAAEQYRVARAQFAQGAVLSADVLSAEAAYRRAGTRLAEAQAGYAIARAELAHAASVPVDQLR